MKQNLNLVGLLSSWWALEGTWEVCVEAMFCHPSLKSKDQTVWPSSTLGVVMHCAVSEYRICRKKAFLEGVGQGSLLGSGGGACIHNSIFDQYQEVGQVG